MDMFVANKSYGPINKMVKLIKHKFVFSLFFL